MISQVYSEEKLKSILIPSEEWQPFPTVEDRDAWQNLSSQIRQVHVARGDSALDYQWPTLPATRFLDFARHGNRSRYQNLCFARRNTLVDLVIAECIDGQERFLDDITNGIWAICEESFWGVPAHISGQKAGTGLPDISEPIVDLFAAETSSLLAWIAYLIGPQLDTVSPLIVPRIKLEIDRRILTPLLQRDDFWWMGFNSPTRRVNNWNPWICSNWLASTLLIEQDETLRARSVFKAIQALDNFIDQYPQDGGCDEGPGYWGRAGASLYDCLELLYSATDGQISVYDHPLIRNIGQYIYRVQINDRYFVNFADASAMITPSPGIVYGFGKRINDDKMMALGTWSAYQQDILHNGVSDSIGRQLVTIPKVDEILEGSSLPPLPQDVWLDQIQVMAARDRSGSTDGFFVTAKGGHNNESHNHNDVGNFIVYLDGLPVLIDAGVEAYTAKTFSSSRYEIWTMQSNYHNVPTVAGFQQAPGITYAADKVQYHRSDDAAELVLDIAKAYPEKAGIGYWERSIKLNRGRDLIIIDRYDLIDATTELCLNLLTACSLIEEEQESIKLQSADLPDGRRSGMAKLQYEAEKLIVETEEIRVEDENLRRIWGAWLTRIILKTKRSSQKDSWRLRITPLTN